MRKVLWLIFSYSTFILIFTIFTYYSYIDTISGNELPQQYAIMMGMSLFIFMPIIIFSLFILKYVSRKIIIKNVLFRNLSNIYIVLLLILLSSFTTSLILKFIISHLPAKQGQDNIIILGFFISQLIFYFMIFISDRIK